MIFLRIPFNKNTLTFLLLCYGRLNSFTGSNPEQARNNNYSFFISLKSNNYFLLMIISSPERIKQRGRDTVSRTNSGTLF